MVAGRSLGYRGMDSEISMVKSGPKPCVAPICKHGGWYAGNACGEVSCQQEASVVRGQGLDQEEIRYMCSDFNRRLYSQKDGPRGKVETFWDGIWVRATCRHWG